MLSLTRLFPNPKGRHRMSTFSEMFRSSQAWKDFKSKAQEKLKEDIQTMGFDKATEKHFALFCLAFQVQIRNGLSKPDLSENSKSQILSDLWVEFVEAIIESK